MTPIDPNEYVRMQNEQRSRVKNHTDPLPSGDGNPSKLISYLLDELPPVFRHLRAGALMAATVMVIGMVSDVMADPELYATIIMIANIVEGVIGQGVKSARKNTEN